MEIQGTVELVASVLCVTADARIGDVLAHELRAVAPDLRLEVLADVGAALQRLEENLGHDAVLIDTELPGDDALRLIGAIRGLHLPLAIVLLVGGRQENPPLAALEAGADDYFVKGSGQAVPLCETVRQAIERRRAEHELILHPLRTLVLGDFEEIRRNIDHLPFIRLAEGRGAPGDETEVPPDERRGDFPYDLVLIDDSITVPRALQALKEVRLKSPDVPVVMLMAPEDGDAAVQAAKLGASECIVKAGNHYHRLVPVLTQLVHLRNLVREQRRLKSTETHLRIVIETVPVSVTVLAGDGGLMALNRTGLSLLGATSPEQVVGRNIASLVPAGQQRKLLAFLEGICAGREGTIQFDCTGLDGLLRRLDLRAVPLWREVEHTITVLGVLREASGAQAASTFPAPVAQAASTATSLQRAQADRRDAEWEESLRAELATAKEELKTARMQLTAQKEESRAYRTRAEREFLDMEKRELALQAEVESARDQIEELSRQVEEGRREVERVKREEGSRAAALQSSLNAHFDGLTRVEEERRLERERVDKDRQELAGRCLELESALSSAEVGLAGQSQEFEARLNSSEEARLEAEKRLAEWQELAALQSGRLETAERERDAFAAQLNESDSRLAAMLKEQLERAESAERQSRELEEKNASLGATLRRLESQAAATHRELEMLQSRLAEAQQEVEKERQLRAGLEASLQRSETERGRVGEQMRRERGDWEELMRKAEEHQAESDRLRTLLAESATLSQNLLKQQTEGFQKLLSDTMARLHQDADTRLQLQASQHAQERESLERTLRDAESRLRRLAEQVASTRRHVDDEVRRVRAEYARLLDSGFVGLATTTPEGRLVNCNAAFAEFFGFEDAEAATADPALWLARLEGDRGPLHVELQNAGGYRDAELRVCRPDGTVQHLVETATMVAAPDGQEALVEHCFLDVTDTHLLRDEQRRARRLRALSDLAAAALDTLNELADSFDSADAFGSASGADHRQSAEAFVSKLPAVGDAGEQEPAQEAETVGQHGAAESADAVSEDKGRTAETTEAG